MVFFFEKLSPIILTGELTLVRKELNLAISS